MHHSTNLSQGLPIQAPGMHASGRARCPLPAGEGQRRLREGVFRFDGFEIGPATTHHQYRAANMLVRRMYAWRGYRTDAISHGLDHPHRVTLAAWRGSDTVATLTLNRDSPQGLFSDELYGDEVNRFRDQGRVLCEVSRLAVDPDSSSRYLLVALFRAAQQYAKEIFGGTDAVIEVNPRHAKYYSREFGFSQIGQLRQCPRVDAPAVLLHREISPVALPVSRSTVSRFSGGPSRAALGNT